MGYKRSLTPETRALYDRVGRLYMAGVDRATIMAELGIDGPTYKKAYSYLHCFKMIRPRVTYDRAPKAKPAQKSQLPIARSAAVSPAAPMTVADFISRHGSHVCKDRFNCRLPGVHLVTRIEGVSDFAAPEIKRPMQYQSPVWKKEFAKHQAWEKVRAKRRAA
jgi:hypothetical protein